MKFHVFPLVFCFILSIPFAVSQTEQTAHVKKADFRAQGPSMAVNAALNASKEDIVVVVIRGGSGELIEQTEASLKALIRSGYNRVGLILGDSFPDEKQAKISVFSDAYVYAVIDEAKVDDYTKWALYKLVKDAYEEDIWPKLNKGVGND